ncbi:O-succinylbenzoic acid--CoA ligase [Variovorax sp. WS11]|uniref:class I adenylate-forming enzyme family protein n=1 Tax=Variovorax sp. WS11 TaxID=1105204 RepID=UPI000D0DB9FA|nr:AMP-binding protein [Variovorax sp. WS11]NDZ17637.1 long-chain fatty acid--CoA ligase [Variovorax sp. WS11]PSL79579.1 O-succinylbenzoic acid--CoA ligase [Variovorax sp. WS11]
MSSAAGIPQRGDFDKMPRTTPDGQHWHVPPQVNRVADVSVFGDRRVPVYERRPRSYDAMFRASVARAPHAEAVVCGDRRLTYAELDSLIERTAFGLKQAGLANGQRVAVMLDNRLEYVVAMLACVRAGGVAVPMGTRLGPADVAHIVSHCEPAFVVTAHDWADRFPLSSSVQRTWLVSDSDREKDFERLADAPATVLPELAEEDTMMIVYTSGTTGKPKGACLTHLNFAHTCLHYLYALGIDAPQRALLVVPGTHIAGFGPVLSVTLASGGALVLMREFKSTLVLQVLERERITYSVMVPAMIQLCQMDRTLGERDLSAWRYCIYGGAIMPAAVIGRFSEVLPSLQLVNAYGATETCAVCSMMPAELTAQTPDSVGLVLECDVIIIVDEQGNEVPPGTSGELLVSGPNVFPRYWNDPDETARAFRNGYWRSGDIAKKDSAGRIYVLDRLKDMINRGGFKVFSAEVENSLLQHPGVADCAVVGVPDPVLGERTFALVQSKDAATTSEELAAFLAARIADYKRPDFWKLTCEPLPRNQNGKLQKNQVKALAQHEFGA